VGNRADRDEEAEDAGAVGGYEARRDSEQRLRSSDEARRSFDEEARLSEPFEWN
jgi:hypothetical protein